MRKILCESRIGIIETVQPEHQQACSQEFVIWGRYRGLGGKTFSCRR